jgi:uncharacterized protein (DUF2164 family)
MIFKLSLEEKNKFIGKIQNFFETERDETIGVIAAEKALDFFMEELGVLIYNRSVDDARKWLLRKFEDLETDFDQLYK